MEKKKKINEMKLLEAFVFFLSLLLPVDSKEDLNIKRGLLPCIM